MLDDSEIDEFDGLASIAIHRELVAAIETAWARGSRRPSRRTRRCLRAPGRAQRAQTRALARRRASG